MRAAQRGAAFLEYLGVVVAVGLVATALVVTRPFEAPRRPPVDPFAHLRALVKPPPRPVVVRPAARRPRPARRPPSRPSRPLVEAPPWAIGR